MSNKQDQAVMQQAITTYQQQNLLKLEQSIYIDFIERRLNIERIGSEAYLERLYSLVENKNADQLITLLLKDRSFFPYVLAEGRLFMSALEFKKWQTQRIEIINPIVDQLNELHFALSIESYGISDLISYQFIESSGLWLALNIIILLVCGSFLEFRLGASKVLLLFFNSTFMCGVFYLLLASEVSPVLQGLAGMLCALIGACFVQVYLSYRDGLKLKFGLALISLTVLISGCYLWALWFWDKTDIRGLSMYTIMFGLGAGLYVTLWRLECLINLAKFKTDEVDHNQKDREYRAELTLAMESLSRFNFGKAREQLRLMDEHYPDSPELKEQRYHIEKLYPHETFYWASVRDLVNYAIVHNDYRRMVFIFEDIQKNAPSKQRAKDSLEPKYYHKMMTVFVAHDDLNKAEKVFLFLELAGNIDIIKDACQLLIHEFKTRKIKSKEQQYLMLFERILP